ncbi:retrovirus-related pol polyprotein from transposon TNT 1-94 [Tanacetum coccineum]
MKFEESLNVTFDESLPPTKLSPLVDDDVGEEEAIGNNIKVENNNNIDDESIEVDDVINIKESKNQPLGQDLVPLHKNQSVIGTKWVYRNKLDENGIVSRNKARLVAQGYNQQEGLDYDETYAPVARLEYIRIILAIACANDFKLYQMDALYGLKQTPKALYDRLKAFLLKCEYSMGMVDNTLFTKKFKSHLIIVQIYVDDIIFGSTCQNLCDDFAKIMHDEFKMSMMGELNFFLGLQIKHMEDGIFFNQSKYIKEMFKKFGLEDTKPTKTSMSTEIKLIKDDEADSVDSTKYRAITIPRTTNRKLQRDSNTLFHDDLRPEVKGWELFIRENVFSVLDISRKTIKDKGKRADPPSSTFSSSSSDENKEPSFWKFYEELSDNEELTDEQREKRGMFKCLNRYFDTITNEEHQNERTLSPSPIGKSLSPPNAPSKTTSSRSTYQTSSSSPSDSPTPTHVAPPPKLRFDIPMKLEPQELPP